MKIFMIRPPTLKPGDIIGLCSPSGTIAHKQDLFEAACRKFEQATGLTTVVAPNAVKARYYSAGTPEERLSDFHGLLGDPTIKAIVFSGGGDTAIDLLPGLDFHLIRNNPKIIAGISDATTLLSAITAKTGLITFLGLEFLDFASHEMPYHLASLKKSWFEGTPGHITKNPAWQDLQHTQTRYRSWQTIRDGVAEGRLVGGNSESFIQLLGTDYELSAEDAILFLETYKLPKKRIHKTLMQLKLHGVLDSIRGLLLGYCLECDDPAVRGNEQPLEELVGEVMRGYDIPIMHIGEIGHCVENALQPIGARARMDATKLELEILENVTE